MYVQNFVLCYLYYFVNLTVIKIFVVQNFHYYIYFLICIFIIIWLVSKYTDIWQEKFKVNFSSTMCYYKIVILVSMLILHFLKKRNTLFPKLWLKLSSLWVLWKFAYRYAVYWFEFANRKSYFLKMWNQSYYFSHRVYNPKNIDSIDLGIETKLYVNRLYSCICESCTWWQAHGQMDYLLLWSNILNSEIESCLNLSNWCLLDQVPIEP